MSVSIAEKSGFCSGVRRAVNKAILSRKDSGNDIHTLRPLIHNDDVCSKLSEG